MKKKEAFGFVALIFFGSVLFTPASSNIWIYFLVLGVVFGILWLFWNN